MPGKDVKIDRWFINDRYWLMVPFQLMWDKTAQITVHGIAPLPIPPGTARYLKVVYPNVGGYTPGDAYDIFYGDDYLLRQWIYHKGGTDQPTLINTWESYVRIGHLLFSTEHRNASGTFHLAMQDLGVKFKGDTDWRTAEPLK